MPFPRAVLKSPEYAALSTKAVKMLLDLSYQYEGASNGNMRLTWGRMKKCGWKSKQTIERARDELLAADFLTVTRQGGSHKETLYALTFFAIDDVKDIDAEPTNKPTSCWNKIPKVFNIKEAQQKQFEKKQKELVDQVKGMNAMGNKPKNVHDWF